MEYKYHPKRVQISHGFLACVAGAKRGGGREKIAKERKRGGSACYKSRCFCIPPTFFWSNLITSTVNTWPITSRALLSMLQTQLLCLPKICQVDTLFSSDIIIEWIKTSLQFLLPQQTRQTYRLRTVSLFFYWSQSTTNYDQFRVNSQDLWSYLI